MATGGLGAGMRISKSRGRAVSVAALAALLAGSGILHLVAPVPYRHIVPRFLGHAAELVLASGLAELVCAAAILIPGTRRVGGYATVALFIAVFPANVQMALDGGIQGTAFPFNSSAVAWLRLPLQLPLILWALSVARQRDR